MKKTFCVDDLIMNFEGLPEVMLIDALESYCNEAQVYINELRSADTETAVRHAHSIKTMSKMVGARFMATICEEFEKSEGNGKVKKEHILAHWPEVKIEIETYVASLKY
ncbi:Hpt domain-containing protein [Psychrosphaera aestuarii]|uniref:Hpt domain-containing protein n=1 Tax=Psychrosphaera aestuarii TaxID=1266052 RepID=UPI001B334998|nr:Hpt domain-containing protein [Psychrosphaera aestuarii]